ncbi:MAG TPA: EAL domain-containing protein [Vicinamibacteria bacterium]|jgi:diguanylate cyclase (GGDEF)-like protein/PAS domain S-box-containing protein|nr:EAL domain-containing protein [Vicinamibacteria bacterium]
MGRLLDPGSYAPSAYAVPLLVTAAATFLLGVSIVIRERASRVALLFCLIPLTIDVWLVCFSLMFLSIDPLVAVAWAKIAHAGIPFIAAAIYHFTVAVTYADKRRRLLVWGGWLLSGLFSALFLGTNVLLLGLHRYPWGYYPRYRAAALPYCLTFVGLLLLSLREHWNDSRGAETRTHRLRSRAYLLAFAAASLGCVDYVAAYGIPIYPFGYLPVLAFVALIARTIRRYHLADITPALAAPQIIATMTDALIVYDDEGRIRLLNQAAASLLGHREADLLGAPVASLVDTSSDGSGPLSSALQRREARDQEGRLRARTGEGVDVRVSISPLQSMGGLGAGAVLIARDFRDRMAAEIAVRASEERYRCMFEANPQPMWVYDLETLGFLAVNDAALQHYGYSRAEFLGLSIDDLAAAPDPSHPPDHVSPTVRGNEAVVRQHRRRDGTPIWVQLITHELKLGERPAGFVLVHDVSNELRAERTLRASEAKFRALAETEAAAIFILEGDSLRYVNPALKSMTGLSEPELLKRKFWELAHVDAQERFRERGRAGQRPGARPDRFELKLACLRGEPRWADVTMTPVELEGLPAAVATAFDITERKLAEEALRESERRLRDILDNVQLISLFLDVNGEITYGNEYLLDLVGCREEEIIGQNWFDSFVPEDQREAARRSFIERIHSGVISPHDDTEILTRSGERRQISWSNTVLRDPEGKVIGGAALGADTTERAKAERQLAHGALHDALTGLPNRTLLMDRLEICIARARRRPGYMFAALLLDVDRFKVVNESLGHLAGDQLLIQIARRLETCLRPADSVARLGGDEFAVLIDEIEEAAVPARVAERIQGSLSVPFELASREVFVTASIGIALHKPRYQKAEDLVRDADNAMHRAKEEGRARHREFDTAMHARAVGLLQIVNDLHRAVEREELQAHYQPIMCLRSGQVAGFEALVRWQRPGHGLVFPGDFIRVAEETGLIVPIGLWVLREACRQLRSWQARFSSRRPLMMSVNLSGRQFQQPDLVSEVARIVRETQLPPGSLKLEVTESILMENPDAAAAMLTELKAHGIHVCIDDFGTGYSSLGYLLRFPANTLKIDRSFISGMGAGSPHSDMVVRTIVGLARNLGMDVIAEGVETEEQLGRLQALECDFIQGYHFSKPMAAEGVVELLSGEVPILWPPRA